MILDTIGIALLEERVDRLERALVAVDEALAKNQERPFELPLRGEDVARLREALAPVVLALEADRAKAAPP